MKRTHRMVALSAASLMLALALSACSDGNNGSPSPSSPSPTSSVAPETGSASPSAAPETQASSGEYVGLIDGHSIEIKTANGTEVFQVDPQIEEKITDWEEGAKVKFQYTEAELEVDGEKVKQSTIVTIDKE